MIRFGVARLVAAHHAPRDTVDGAEPLMQLCLDHLDADPDRQADIGLRGGRGRHQIRRRAAGDGANIDRHPLQRIGLAAQLGLDGAASSSSSGQNEFVAPSTATERTLAGIWKQVLGVERVGVHDDFLALGGDSMLAALIIARIRDATDTSVSILAFFEHPTVAELAGLIDRGGEDRLDVRNPIVAASTVGDLPLSSAQRRLWFLAELEEHSTAYNRSNLYRIRGALELGMLERALSRIVARHAVLRTIFQSRAGDPVQIVTAPAAIEIATVDDLEPETT